MERAGLDFGELRLVERQLELLGRVGVLDLEQAKGLTNLLLGLLGDLVLLVV